MGLSIMQIPNEKESAIYFLEEDIISEIEHHDTWFLHLVEEMVSPQ